MSFLELKDIGKIYVNAGNVTVGIRGVNLNFEKGEFVAVTGKSGSGKSTFLNVISGMDTYEEGELLIENEPTSHFLQPDWEKYRSEYISFIFQDYNIIESFTVLQNVELALMHIEDKKERRKRALELIDRVGMTSHIKHKGSKLSGGQKQRTVIARALAKDSPIILADEPTGNLDSATSAEIIKLLGEVSKDKLLIVVTHNYDEVADHATRHIRFFDGAVESDTVLRLPTLTATENKKAEKKNKIVNEKKKDVKDGFTLGKAIFTSRPKLSFFLCLLLLIGSLGIFASTASFGDVSSLFQREKMFTDIEGRVVVTKRNGEIITEEELQQIATEYGAKNVLHYDLLLDMGDDNYFRFLDEEDGYYNRGVFLSCTYNENFGDDIIGKYPTEANEVFLYLPISYSLHFGESELNIDVIKCNEIDFKVSGVKYYIDNNKQGKCLFTEDGFRTATASYYCQYNAKPQITVSITEKNGIEEKFEFYNFVPDFRVEKGKMFIADERFLNLVKTSGESCKINVSVISNYQSLNYNNSESIKVEVVQSDYGKEYISFNNENITKYYSEIYIHPSLLVEMNEKLLEKSYKQASVFFENYKEAEKVAELLNEKEYLAVCANTTFTPDPEDAAVAVIAALITAVMWFLSIVFLTFFVNLCTSRTLGAFKGDMAIMRSMGIHVRVIRIGMYVRTFLAIVPSFIIVPLAAFFIYTSPKLNQHFLFLYPYHYVIMAIGMIVLVTRLTKKQIKKLFGESVKKSLKGGDAE